MAITMSMAPQRVAMVASYLEGVGGQVETYIPHRYKEGYGVSLDGVRYASENRFSLMITLDCGTKDFESLQDAAERGIDVIVCDHHLPEDTLPAAFAVLNPKRVDCPYPFKELSRVRRSLQTSSILGQPNGFTGKRDLRGTGPCCDQHWGRSR